MQLSVFSWKILKFLGFWPDKSSSKVYKLLAFTSLLFNIEFYTIAIVIPLFWTNNMRELLLLFVFGALSVYILLAVRSLNFVAKINGIQELIAMGSEVVQLTEQKHLKRRLEFFRKLSNFLMTSSLMGIAFNFTYSIAISGVLQLELPYELPRPLWFPFDYRHNIYVFIALAVYEFLNAFLMSFACVATDLTPIFFLATWIGLLEELAERLSRLGREAESKAQRIELLKCITIHRKIIACVRRTEEIFNRIILLQSAVYVIILCSMLYVLAEVNELIVGHYNLILKLLSITAFAIRRRLNLC